MKFSAIVLAAVVAAASAARPQLSISVKDGKYDGLDGLDPTLTWESSGKAGDMDLSYGVESSVRPTSDIASLPRSVWGKASTDVSGWGVSARADIDAQDMQHADLDINADNDDLDMNVRVLASAGGAFNVKSVQATKGFDANGARMTVTPRVNLETDDRDVELNYNNKLVNVKLAANSNGDRDAEISYSKDSTDLTLTANADGQEVTLSQQVDGDNRISPTLSSNGDISVAWERRLADGSLTATLKPNDSLDVEWKDQDWTANVNMPIDGTNINGANVSIKRDVSF
jgi:hypothetical protein